MGGSNGAYDGACHGVVMRGCDEGILRDYDGVRWWVTSPPGVGASRLGALPPLPLRGGRPSCLCPASPARFARPALAEAPFVPRFARPALAEAALRACALLVLVRVL
jgi:hypothetical protein